MRRFLILLLIFLIPVQVFAGIVKDRPEHRHEQSISAVYQVVTVATDLFVAAKPGPGNADGQTSDAEEASPDEFAGHSAFGDDAVPAGLLVFADRSSDFISTLHDDTVSIPPYLPPAARPPQA